MSLATYDNAIGETIRANSVAWFRYNFDGYGETNDGGRGQRPGGDDAGDSGR